MVNGNNNSRIINGLPSPEGKWPEMAAIYRFGDFICGGVVWNENTILTAGHCICIKGSLPEGCEIDEDLSTYKIILGHHIRSEADDYYKFDIESVHLHPNYEPDYLMYDIAVVRLKRLIELDGLNEKVKCACEPQPLKNLRTDLCFALGWGTMDPKRIILADHLQEVIIPIQNEQWCREYQSMPGYNPEYHICVSNPEGGKDACKGDSGGPLLCANRKDLSEFSLVGINSYGLHCAMPNQPAYFTRVYEFVDWIKEQSGE
ncbi:hypothetical protein RDWZM_001794 [Blomia tropicalis]|uniref:Peptidase S1 domain-containing protein n=1 Tax=Blomia tropicalis TaxID=40697 RepID=A0A9Q0MD36_BLOTA|nr:hypothetical protein RDWZM_001794 [Blomia tropicalis]